MLIGNITRLMFWQMNAILVQFIIVYLCHIAFSILSIELNKTYHSTEFIKLIHVVHLIAPEHGFRKLHCCWSASVPKIHCDHIVVLPCCGAAYCFSHLWFKVLCSFCKMTVLIMQFTWELSNFLVSLHPLLLTPSRCKQQKLYSSYSITNNPHKSIPHPENDGTEWDLKSL